MHVVLWSRARVEYGKAGKQDRVMEWSLWFAK